MNVLLVTDDPQFKIALRERITAEGFDVSLAKSGREGLQILKANKIHLVITECNLPFMDGLAFCQMTRTSEKNLELPFIITYKTENERKKLAMDNIGSCTFIPRSSVCSEIVGLLHRLTGTNGFAHAESHPTSQDQEGVSQKPERNSSQNGAVPETERVMHKAARILLVDDENTFRLLLHDMLSDEGYKNFTEASDGGQAIELIKQRGFDLVILDIIMPFVSGFGVLHFIHDHAPGTKVIMLTAYADIWLAVEAKELGAADFIVKPVMRTDFFRTIEHVLSQ